MSREASEKKAYPAEPVTEAGGTFAAGLVSVIIPVKGGAGYIARTVGDIVAQTYPDIELIIAGPAEDDGTDTAVEEALKRIPSDRHLGAKYIGRTGEGVSAGRNAGIEAARGKYLVFFDGDDRIDPRTVEYLVKTVQGVDLASCGYDTYDGADAEKIPGLERSGDRALFVGSPAGEDRAAERQGAEESVEPAEPVYETPETVSRVLSAGDYACRLFFQANYQGYVWNKIFRADIVHKYQIRFREDLYYNEDRTFQIEYIIHAERARMAPARYYHYLANIGSAMDLYEEQELNMEGLPPSDDPLFERRVTELDGFSHMLKALKKHRRFSDAAYFCRQTFADKLFSYFFEILADDPERADAFSRSRLRHFARRLPFLIRRPDDSESRYYYHLFVRYGFTGKACEAEEAE